MFDIREQTDRANAVTPDVLAPTAFATRPLARSALRCVRYLADVEAHTIRQLRDLLVTPSHTDPVVTEFLTAWAFQQYWLGETLNAVLAAHDTLPDAPPIPPIQRAVRTIEDRIAPIRAAAVANLLGADFVAMHMAWGAASERLRSVAYQQLSALAGHGELSAALDRIVQQKGHHIAFYEEQARERLALSTRAQSITRFALDNLWPRNPARAAAPPKRESRFVYTYLFTDAMASVRQLDQTIGSLPGLAGVRPGGRMMARYSIEPKGVSA